MRKLLFGCATVALIGVVGCEEIIGPIGDPVNLSYAPCLGASDNPVWFAFQDGDGSWQRVSPSASGSFDFAIASGKGGIAMVNPDDELFVLYATTEEFQANFPACNGSVRNLTGSVTGYATADNVKLVMGTAEDVVFGATSPPAFFTLSGVDATSSDLIAIRYRTSSGGGSAFTAFPNNIFIRRNVTGTSTSIVDFSSSTEAGAPLQREVNVTNTVSGEALGVYSFLNSTNANISVFETSASLVSGSVIGSFFGVPAARLIAGETHVTQVVAAKTVGSTQEQRISTFAYINPVDLSVTLGPALGPVTVSGSSRPSATYNVQSAYDNLFDVVFTQGNGSTFRQAEVLATSSYLDGATTVTLTVPNLSGVSGFSSSWLLATGVETSWGFLATDADLSLLNAKPITYQGAQRLGSFTP